MVDTYADDGISGTVMLGDRPDGARLLADARAGRFETVILYRLDRLGRSVKVLLDAHSELEAAGVTLVSATEPFDTRTAIGRFVFQLLASIAELEKEVIRERMGLGRDRHAREGRWTGGPVPFGYALDADRKLIAASEPITILEGKPASEADVVLRIYREIIAGGSTVAVADLLNSLGVPAHFKYQNKAGKVTIKREDNPWFASKVNGVITSPVYAGRHLYRASNGEVIERECVALVTPEMWHQANAQLSRNRWLATRNAKHDYLLRGLIRCGNCGWPYSGSPMPGREGETETRRAYRCNALSAARGGSKSAHSPRAAQLTGWCPARRLPADRLEAQVWEDIVGIVHRRTETLENARRALAERQPPPGPNVTAERDEIRQALAASREARDDLLTLYRRKRITLAELEAQMDAIDRENAALEGRLAALDADAQQRDATNRYLDTLDATLRAAEGRIDQISIDLASGDPDRIAVANVARRDLVEMFVEQVTVTTRTDGPMKTTEVAVRYKFGRDVVLGMPWYNRMTAPATHYIRAERASSRWASRAGRGWSWLHIHKHSSM